MNRIKNKLDKEEKIILNAIESGRIKPLPKEEQEKMKKMLYQAARNTLAKDKKITLRVSAIDLAKLKTKSDETGIPYQTLLGSLIHRYVEGKIRLEI